MGFGTLSPLKELTDRNEAVENIENKMVIRKANKADKNAKSTGQQRGWKNKEHEKVGLTVLILYNDNLSNKNFHFSQNH